MVLERGMKGSAVKALQEALNKKGASLTPDGVFGATTKLAVMKFQYDNALITDGVVGSKTAEILGIELPKSETTSSSTKFAKLTGVHPNLIKVVEKAATLTKMPFIVNEGLRTVERQRRLVASGASRTMNSKHIKQSDGYGHATDLVPYYDFDGNGVSEVSWQWEHFYPIAEAMRSAAKELGIQVRWGGCWACLNNTTADTQDLVSEYVAARKAQGKRAFIDGPHFELV